MRFLFFVVLFYLVYSSECAAPKPKVLPYMDNWKTREEAMNHCIEPSALGLAYHCVLGETPHKYFEVSNREDLRDQCVNQDTSYDNTTFFCTYHLVD